MYLSSYKQQQQQNRGWPIVFLATKEIKIYAKRTFFVFCFFCFAATFNEMKLKGHSFQIDRYANYSQQSEAKNVKNLK
jgi:hypothetical protein